jgi:hypothetical protein
VVGGGGRGALLGPEESGLNPEGFGTVSSRVTVTLGFWCGGWLGPALTKLLVGSLSGCVVSLGGGFGGVWWMWSWFSCPYFENCIVDASISL